MSDLEKLLAEWIHNINSDVVDAECKQCGKAIGSADSGAVVIAGVIIFLCWDCLSPLATPINAALKEKYPELQGGSHG